MERENCWEFKKCGCEPGGSNAAELGVCPAAVAGLPAPVNGAETSGRVCWTVGGTMCGGKVQGTYARKLMSCLQCDFLKHVQEQEGKAFVLKPSLISEP